jgi:hypothetical protein
MTRGFIPTDQIQGDKSDKYNKYIKPYVKKYKQTKVGGRLITSLNPLETKQYYPNTDLIYWDDLNELVERLRLLIASQNAGNTNHVNEINSIIEELTEAGVIIK